MEKKIEITKWLVENGYHLFNETIEQFASRFPLEVLEMVKENFSNYKGI